MKNEICGIYLITERATGRGYVGQSNDIERRWREHQKSRFPPECFDYRHIMTCPSQDLDFWEIFYIDRIGTHFSKGGFNGNRGGQYYPRPDEPVSPETKQKISEAHKARNSSMTEEEKRERSEALKAALANEEVRKKLSAASKAYHSSMTENEKRERSQKISQSKTGKSGPPQSEETKKKRAETIRGQTRSEEAKKNMSEARKAIAARKRAAKAALEETHTSIEDDQQ